MRIQLRTFTAAFIIIHEWFSILSCLLFRVKALLTVEETKKNSLGLPDSGFSGLRQGPKEAPPYEAGRKNKKKKESAKEINLSRKRRKTNIE